MASTAEGFFFSFGEDVISANPAQTRPSWPEPTVGLTSFPWHLLTSDTAGSHSNEAPSSPAVQQWRTTYPAAGGSNTTRPQCLELQSALHPERVYCVRYQTAPEVTGLRCTAEDTADASGAGALVEPRDIVPGRYYGGLKVWSCGPDLARYMIKHEAQWRRLLTHASVVVEVGCGQAIPGLAALCLGAKRVVLQDYNEEVLSLCTGPNVAATVSSGDLGAVEVKLVHGDWIDLHWDECGSTPSTSTALRSGGGTCDVILGSDVTFDEEACEKLACVLRRWLLPGGGVALIVSKVYYFGTKGGSLEFKACAQRYGMTVEEVERLEEGGGMQRVIMKVTTEL